jgi:hypothetical protein
VARTAKKLTAGTARDGILLTMHPHHIPWGFLGFELVKLLKIFGLLPGAVAAYGIRKLYQSRRQKKAMAGWPSTHATVQYALVHKEGPRSHWTELTYSYFVGEYRSGQYIRRFRREEDAEEFARQMKDKQIQVHYTEANPEHSVILDRDVEMVALLTPQLR